jgi:hypothetical protein
MSDSDSDSDSNYDPEKDKERDKDDRDEEEAPSGLQIMPPRRKRKAEELWESMVMEDKQETQSKMTKVVPRVGYSAQKAKKKSKKNEKQLKELMRVIFGSNGNGQQKVAKALAETSDDVADVKEAARLAARNINKKETVDEVRKFAGQEVVVTVTKASSSSSSSQPGAGGSKPSSSLDAVLDTIKGPKVISTVAKSSTDWDTYKEQEGLDDALQNASKDGFLHRKEFLDRCDVRAFENERDERLKKAGPTPASGAT